MLFLTLVTLIVNAVSITATVDLNNYTFEQYLKDYNIRYHPSELTQRKEIFYNEIKNIINHNNDKTKSYKLGINKFTTMTAEEKKGYLGRSKGVHRNHQPKNLKSLPDDFRLKDISELPTNVDWREVSPSVVSAVKDQGHCGSCWAFASTAVIESHVALSSGLLYDLSVEQMAMCAPNPDSCGGTGGCMGSTAELAFDYVTGSSGLVQEFQYPYTSYYGQDFDCTMPPSESPVATIDGYVKLPTNNYTALMNAVATVGPVAISVDASTWHNYESGIYNGCNQENPDIDHGVVLMGYGTDEVTGENYWLIRNSWSPGYGEKGYIRIARGDFEEDNCGMDVTPEDGIACEGDHEPIRACGTCGVLFDAGYPLNAVAL